MGQIQVVAGSVAAEIFIAWCYFINIESAGKDVLLFLGIVVALLQIVHLFYNISEKKATRKAARKPPHNKNKAA